MLLAVLDSLVDQGGIFGFLGGGKDEGRIGGGVLRLVLANGGKVTGVADNGLRRGCGQLGWGSTDGVWGSPCQRL